MTMADDPVQTQLARRNCVRLCVEPVEVELEEADGSLLFAALQSAFPNSTAVYFRPKGTDCRAMLKFDGKRFVAPSGGWQSSVEYFVELGGSRHTPFPFGSYEQASKQFERSVNLVRQMMNGGGGGGGPKLMGNGQERRRESAESEEEQIIQIQQQQEGERSRKGSDSLLRSGRMSASSEVIAELRSTERDFADLARICAGKDAVIEGLRTELDRTKAELDGVREREAERDERETEWRGRAEAAERELDMLRELGREQQALHGQVIELERQLEYTKRVAEENLAEMESKLAKSQKEANDLRQKCELGAWTVKELNEQLKKAQREKADLLKKTATLEEQVNGEAMEFGKRFQERERMQRELLADNTRLYQIKEQLEVQCGTLAKQLESATAETEAKLNELRAEIEAKEMHFRETMEANERKLAETEDKMGQLAGEREKLLEELRRVSTHSHQGNGDPIFSCYQE